jgi:putative colanic acid biosynthesis acetyltransferase WcaF
MTEIAGSAQAHISAATHFQDLASSRVPAGFRGRPAWFVQLWWFVQASLFAWSPQVLYSWRSWLLRLFGMKIGTNVKVRPTARVTYPWKVSIGDHSWIGDDVVLYSLGEIDIGANCVVSQRSYLCAATHNHQHPSFELIAGKITIEDEVWLAADVFVAPGRRVGRGTVVGARSNVFLDLAGGMICVGSPAKAIGPRLSEPDSESHSSR